MEKKSEILEKIGRQSGMTVPEGYFADFASRMTASLPPLETQMETAVPHRSFWQKVRPFAYMAAMFAGIWCMMKMFSLMGGGAVDLSLDNYPGVITALGDDNFVREYVYPDIDQYDLIEDMYDSGVSAEDIFSQPDEAAVLPEDTPTPVPEKD